MTHKIFLLSIVTILISISLISAATGLHDDLHSGRARQTQYFRDSALVSAEEILFEDTKQEQFLSSYYSSS